MISMKEYKKLEERVSVLEDILREICPTRFPKKEECKVELNVDCWKEIIQRCPERLMRPLAKTSKWVCCLVKNLFLERIRASEHLIPKDITLALERIYKCCYCGDYRTISKIVPEDIRNHELSLFSIAVKNKYHNIATVIYAETHDKKKAVLIIKLLEEDKHYIRWLLKSKYSIPSFDNLTEEEFERFVTAFSDIGSLFERCFKHATNLSDKMQIFVIKSFKPSLFSLSRMEKRFGKHGLCVEYKAFLVNKCEEGNRFLL